ncbi:phosphoglycerate mutase family protein [Candidatus Berkiella cookevillensis]|uniref:Bifunctional RNase H/acid phosphatase n=1 Tax=Candidatus Berkiella cookevillensis TaxID=437022 RepID=A0A0Q9YUU6_9GAMM|nr:histidine phosphatase family protein [Candidatus Berkiella cookevillensis]MCS5708528.1 phosphoglycerate mutase family protein [Candidatus Berkiella cookevillensis]
MSSVTLYLYRHGNTFEAGDKVVQVGLKSDLPLTTVGKQQAESFGAYLQKSSISPNSIFSGQLQRQTESAHILQSYFPQTILKTHVQALDEIDYGLWEGLTANEITENWEHQAQCWHTQAIWPNDIFKQSREYHLQHITEFLTALYNKQGEKNAPVIVVSSNGIIRLFLYFSNLWENICATSAMNNYKVGTGNFCKVQLHENNIITIDEWNVNPAKRLS